MSYGPRPTTRVTDLSITHDTDRPNTRSMDLGLTQRKGSTNITASCIRSIVISSIIICEDCEFYNAYGTSKEIILSARTANVL